MQKAKLISHSKPTSSLLGGALLCRTYFCQHYSDTTMQKKCEDKLSSHFRRKNCILLNSCTSCIHLLLSILINNKKNEVLLLGYTCSDIYDSIMLSGGIPRVYDLKYDDEIDFREISRRLSDKTAAIIIQHTFGRITHINDIEKINIPIIEDCTHSFSSVINHSYIVTSFGATKLISAGEGGAILLNNDIIANTIKNSRSGEGHYPYRQSDIHAAILYSNLFYYNKIILKRMKIAKRYNKKLKNIDFFKLPNLDEYSAVYRYVVRFYSKIVSEKFMVYMKSNGIMCEKPLSPCNKFLCYKNTNFDYYTIVSIPIYPDLNIFKQYRIIRKIKEFKEKYNEI